MFSMPKSRELDEEQRQDADVNKRHYGEDVKFYHMILLLDNNAPSRYKFVSVKFGYFCILSPPPQFPNNPPYPFKQAWGPVGNRGFCWGNEQ